MKNILLWILDRIFNLNVKLMGIMFKLIQKKQYKMAGVVEWIIARNHNIFVFISDKIPDAV